MHCALVESVGKDVSAHSMSRDMQVNQGLGAWWQLRAGAMAMPHMNLDANLKEVKVFFPRGNHEQARHSNPYNCVVKADA